MLNYSNPVFKWEFDIEELLSELKNNVSKLAVGLSRRELREIIYWQNVIRIF